MNDLKQDIISIMHSGIEAVQPASLMQEKLALDADHLMIGKERVELHDLGRIAIIAVGKAAFAMALEADKILGRRINTGICICKHAGGVALPTFTVIEAGHPLPNAESVKAAKTIIEVVDSLNEDDLLIMLISGGASSLVADIPDGLSLSELQNSFELLINSGASIHEINLVRKHLATLKGGQLTVRAFPARVYSLIISDVVGDDTGTIGSGLTAPDESSFNDAKEVLTRYDCWPLPADSIRTYIEKGINKEIAETPKPGEPVFDKVKNIIIGSNAIALKAAAMKANALGYHTTIITDKLASSTEQAAKQFNESISNYNDQLPACLFMGGETTLHVNGRGKGGRNLHFVLALLNEWMQNGGPANKRVELISAGTDGGDGPTDAAGAIIDSGMLDHIDAASVQRHLKAFDSYTFFDQHNMLIKTGPTQTNVMDIMIALLVDDAD